MCACILLLKMCEVIEALVSKHQNTHPQNNLFCLFFLCNGMWNNLWGEGSITHPKGKKICPVLRINCQNYD